MSYKPDELEHVGPGSPDTSTTRLRSSQDKGPDRNPDQTRFDLQGLSVIMGPIPNCFCNLEAKTWISYIPKHRKKTFYRCRKDQENQCQFFQWTQFQPLEDLVAWRRDTDDQGNTKPLGGDRSGNDPEQMHSRTDKKQSGEQRISDSNFMSEVRKDPLQHGQGTQDRDQDRDQDRGGRVRTISQVHSMEEEARQTDVSGKVVRKIQKLT